jgi:putative transposase
MHRKTMRRDESVHSFRFITFSCFQRLPLLSNDRVKQVFVDRLSAVRAQHPFSLAAWVIMPEHIHLLLRPSPDTDLVKLLHSMKRPVAERVLRRWRELEAPILRRLQTKIGGHRFWQPGGGYDRNLRAHEEVLQKIQYIHDNPCRRKLCRRPIDWIWSSARWHEGLPALIDCDRVVHE